MDVLFKKYFWVVQGVGVAGATALAASAITTQLGTRFVLATDDVEAAAGGDTDGGDGEDADADSPTEFGDNPFGLRPSTRNRSPNKDKLATEIQRLNIFCPSCVPQEGESNVLYDENGRPIGAVVDAGESRTSLPLKLMATMEATDPRFSLATIFDSENDIVGVYTPGDVVRAGVMVTEIDRGVVHLRNGASLEYLDLLNGNAPPPVKPTKAPKPEEESGEKSERFIEGAEESINCPSENLCIVERAFVEKLMSNPALLAKQARIIPAMQDGEAKGFKFYGIRKDSLPRMLGLKNGDMLTAVNGEDLTSMDKAMGLYTKLRHASNLSVTIDRKGESINKEIQIK